MKVVLNGKNYYEDSNGALVPAENLKALDLLRDELVMELIKKTQTMNSKMIAFKKEISEKITSFVELSADEYKVKLGGKKGNIKLRTIDGKYMVQVAQNETLDFNEQLQVAENLIEECISDRATAADPLLLTMVRAAFIRDREGSVNVRSILKLQRYDIDDPKWNKAMTAIKNSIETTGSKEYIRFYERRDKDQKMVPISLDLAAL